MDGPAALKQARGVRDKPQASANRHGAGDRQRRQARRCRILSPYPVARRPTRGELVQARDDRDIFQTSPDELSAIDIDSL